MSNNIQRTKKTPMLPDISEVKDENLKKIFEGYNRLFNELYTDTYTDVSGILERVEALEP